MGDIIIFLNSESTQIKSFPQICHNKMCNNELPRTTAAIFLPSFNLYGHPLAEQLGMASRDKINATIKKLNPVYHIGNKT